MNIIQQRKRIILKSHALFKLQHCSTLQKKTIIFLNFDERKKNLGRKNCLENYK